MTSRYASRLTERIYSHDGWYWWSWAEKITPHDNAPAAAAKIAAVLHARPARA